MAELDPAEIVGSHMSLILKWWVVIVAVFSLGYAGVKKGVIAPRTELAKLGNSVDDIRDDLADQSKRLDRVERRLEKMMDMIMRLHTAHGLDDEED